jgi:bleomycin hydrolase
MNKLILLLAFTLTVFHAEARVDKKKKEAPSYEFESIADVPVTSMKNQYKSGTCWSFAAASYVEAEILRLTKEDVDLSEMFFVYHAYVAKAWSYVRLHGKANFSPGGQAHDVMDVIRDHGVINEEDYPGLQYGTDNHIHGELDAVLGEFLKGVIANKNKALTPVWPVAFTQLLNTYLAEPAAKTSSGISTLAYAKKLKINPDDYIEITSYTHHPFYGKFRLELPDNWSFDPNYYNLPIDELMAVIDHALKNGYSVCWDGDVSDKGFNHRKGVAVLPETQLDNMEDTEMSRWQSPSAEDLRKSAYAFEGPVPERKISQADRQKGFDNYTTTDDHLMHLTGLVKDQMGTMYYKTKNSWGRSNTMGGYLNMSEAYLRLHTVAIMVHKEALSTEIKQKLGL